MARQLRASDDRAETSKVNASLDRTQVQHDDHVQRLKRQSDFGECFRVFQISQESRSNDPTLRGDIKNVIEGRAPASNPPTYPRPPASDLRRKLEEAGAKVEAREAVDLAEKAKFKNATNENGELLHPYFEEVEPAMIALAQSYVASGQPVPARSVLYETAVWANTSTRAALEAHQRAAEEARAKAAKERKPRSAAKNDEIAILLKKRGYLDGTHGKSMAHIARLLEKDLNMPKMADPIRAISRRIERYYDRQRRRFSDVSTDVQ